MLLRKILLVAAFSSLQVACTQASTVEDAPASAPELEAAPTVQPEAYAPEDPAASEPSEVPDRPTEASPAQTEGLPPYPGVPAALVEQQPSPELRGSTRYVWLPGHWVWSGDRYTWQSGVWIYPVQGYDLIPPRWVWDGDYWGFRDAGWGFPGSTQVQYRPTALPDGDARVAPKTDSLEAMIDLQIAPSSYAVFVWTGRWVPPPIVYPSDGNVLDGRARYPRQPRAEGTAETPVATPPAAQALPSQVQVVLPAQASNDDGEVELVPGVLHGGKRGEEEMRLLEKQRKEEEEAEAQEGVDAIFVPYNNYPYNYPYNGYRPPNRPQPQPLPSRPPRPRPRPAPPRNAP